MSSVTSASAAESLLLRSNKDPKFIQDYVDSRWLGLGDVSTINTPNLWNGRTEEQINNPHVFLLDLMRRPENIGFTASILFNKYGKLAPFQIAIYQELWRRPFPMLLGSRGLGKCLKGDTLIATNKGICRIQELASDAEPMEAVVDPALSVLGENGYKKVAYSWNNGFGPTRVINTRMGYKLEGTHNHPIRVVSNGDIVWKDMSDVEVGDTVVIDRSESWHPCENSIDEETGYFLGLLTGDGGYTIRGRITFTNADQQLISFVDKKASELWGKGFHYINAKYQHTHYSMESWDRLFSEYGFNSSACGEKDFPTCVLSGSKAAAAGFIRGMMDTDGSVLTNLGVIEFAAKSENMARTMQFILGRFGIVAKFKYRFNEKYKRFYHYLYISGPSMRVFQEKIGFGLKRKQDLLKIHCNKASNANLDCIPRELVLNDILTLQLSWANVRPESHRGDKNVLAITPYRLKSYKTTYAKLQQLLDITSPMSDTYEWRKLKAVYDQNYYYDTVKSVAESACATYDVHVPEDHSFLSNGFISHNSWLLALYLMIRLLFEQGRRAVVVGAAFRQSKVVFDYCKDLWADSPVLRSLVASNKHSGPRKDVDRCTMQIGESIAVFLPMGDGSKIRGQRSSITVAEELASIDIEVFNTVVRGFSSVSMNPIEKMIDAFREQALKELKLWNAGHEAARDNGLMANQLILSGTASYSFNHFFDYWKRYKAIIESRGDPKQLADISGGKFDAELNWKDYSIIRVPADRLPKGFMDSKTLAQAKATVHSGTFSREYGSCFTSDSNGFYKRSLIETCVVGRPANEIVKDCGVVIFHAVLRGNPAMKYIMSVDPASENDNCSISIIEIWPDHRRTVFCWTTKRAAFKAKLKKGLTNGEDNFYKWVARKIRDLAKSFPCWRLAIDSQGGGVAIMEALQEKEALKKGEKPFYPVVDPENPKDTDGDVGDHIIEIINFASGEWVSFANHGMRFDLEQRILLFPEFNSSALGLAWEDDKVSGRVKVHEDELDFDKLYDTLEDCMMEIEELKDELATIVHSQTGKSLRDRWDTPEVKQEGGKKGRLRKDRYSALLMANAIARKLAMTPDQPEYQSLGGFAHEIRSDTKEQVKARGDMWSGPDWWVGQANDAYSAVCVVRR